MCSEHDTVINLSLTPYVGSSVDEILTCKRKQTVSDSYVPQFTENPIKSSIGLSPLFAKIIQEVLKFKEVEK